MAIPLLLAGSGGALMSAAGTGAATWWVTSSGMKDEDLKAKIGGYDARTVLGLGGLAIAMLMPALAPLGWAMVAGGVTGHAILGKMTEGIEDMVKRMVADQISQQMPTAPPLQPPGTPPIAQGPQLQMPTFPPAGGGLTAPFPLPEQAITPPPFAPTPPVAPS